MSDVYEHHVVYLDGHWVVKSSGEAVVAAFPTQEEAVEVGYQLAVAAGEDLVVFDEDGNEVERIVP
jgi:hypothetical protein